jgi:transcriptional regulator with XRE-family HTH domain
MNHHSRSGQTQFSRVGPFSTLPNAQTIDSVVGEQIRSRRTALKMSQKRLGEQIGVSFQQIQKYELGKNRVSSSKLFEIAFCLKVPPSYFFEPLLTGPAPTLRRIVGDDGRKHFAYVATREGARLVETAMSLPRPVRLDLLRLMETLSK